MADPSGGKSTDHRSGSDAQARKTARVARACRARTRGHVPRSNARAFIGPTPDQILAFGLKHTARALATKAGVPLLPGTALLTGIAQARRAAKKIGYPVMLKSTAGGGGIGMRRCADSPRSQDDAPVPQPRPDLVHHHGQRLPRTRRVCQEPRLDRLP